MQLRTGRKLGRTIYLQLGDEPSDTDPFVGILDQPEDAGLLCAAVNTAGLAQHIAANARHRR